MSTPSQPHQQLPENPQSPQDVERLSPPRGINDYQLTRLRGERPPMPDWAQEALKAEPERTTVEVEGASIEVLSWGEKSLPPLLLLHGSRACADWWVFTAPFLRHDYRVIALSSSGMGGSEWRANYSISQMAREAIAVAEAFDLFAGDRKPIFVGHSFGGYPALHACLIESQRIGGVLVVDTILLEDTILHQPWRVAEPEPQRRYASIQDALARFRLLPSRPTENLWAIDEIARRSLREIPETGEMRWHFDNALFAKMAQEDLSAFSRIETPVAMMRGEFSDLLTAEVRKCVEDLFGADIPDIVIPHAGHHVMIDQPLAFAAALRTLLGSWPATPGKDRRSRLGSEAAS